MWHCFLGHEVFFHRSNYRPMALSVPTIEPTIYKSFVMHSGLFEFVLFIEFYFPVC